MVCTYGQLIREFLRGLSLLTVSLCLASAACRATPTTTTTLFEDTRGSVFLQDVSDRSFRASHPIRLEPSLLVRILEGVSVQERQRALQTVLAGSAPALSAFSEEDIQFLVPLITKALVSAQANQLIGFSVTRRRPEQSPLGSPTTETTSGALYVHGTSLYFSLSQYRSAPARTDTDSIAHRRLPDSSGLSEHVLLFSPSFAQGSDTVHRSIGGGRTEKVLVINYPLLEQPSPSTTEPRAAPPAQESLNEPSRRDGPVVHPPVIPVQTLNSTEQRDVEIHSLKDLIVKKDLELETLRKELRSIRKQLDSQATRQDSQKRKTAPSLKPQHTTP